VTGVLEELASLLGLAFVSALVPVVNIEVILAGRGSLGGLDNIWLLSLAAAFGQMLGKLVWYYLGANSLQWGWVRRKMEKPKARSRLELWRTRTQERPVLAGALVLASAASGFPPFAILSVLAGQLRMSLTLFFCLGLVGRWARFAAVLGGAEYLKNLLS
jgi:membrane protein YqaA with SNARE-associated domain